MRHTTLTCPVCGTPDKAVGDPDEKDEGHSGSWFCFACKSAGDFEIVFTTTSEGELP